jgi:hypothetical protein
MGFPKPEETEIGIDIAYSTAIFEQPEDAPSDWKTAIVLPSAPGDSRGVVLAPIENNLWLVSIAGNHGDAPPGDMEGFLAFVRTLRTTTVYDAIKDAKPVGEIFGICCLQYAKPLRESCALPRGLLPVGDAIRRFNLGFCARHERGRLKRPSFSIDSAKEPWQSTRSMAGRRFFAEIQAVLETPWG